eukprot:3936148-Rhodomonas_salina.1
MEVLLREQTCLQSLAIIHPRRVLSLLEHAVPTSLTTLSLENPPVRLLVVVLAARLLPSEEQRAPHLAHSASEMSHRLRAQSDAPHHIVPHFLLLSCLLLSPIPFSHLTWHPCPPPKKTDLDPVTELKNKTQTIEAAFWEGLAARLPVLSSFSVSDAGALTDEHLETFAVGLPLPPTAKAETRTKDRAGQNRKETRRKRGREGGGGRQTAAFAP